MIKLLDIHSQNKHGCVALLFADTREEVPAYGYDTVAEDLVLPLLAGSAIITAGGNTAFLMSNGAWWFEGEDKPVVSEPVDLEFDLGGDYNGTAKIAYIDGDTDEFEVLTREYTETEPATIRVKTGSVVVCSTGSAIGSSSTIDTNCTYELGTILGEGGQTICTVYIDNAEPYIRKGE